MQELEAGQRASCGGERRSDRLEEKSGGAGSLGGRSCDETRQRRRGVGSAQKGKKKKKKKKKRSRQSSTSSSSTSRKEERQKVISKKRLDLVFGLTGLDPRPEARTRLARGGEEQESGFLLGKGGGSQSGRGCPGRASATASGPRRSWPCRDPPLSAGAGEHQDRSPTLNLRRWLKSLEMTARGGNWQLSQRLELVPFEASSMASERAIAIAESRLE